MPWTPETFTQRHNSKLSGRAASTAARQATAMVREGVSEGEAIATANKTGNRLQRAKGSPKSRDDHMARKAKHATHAKVAADFGVSRPTVSRAVKRAGYQALGSAR